MLSHPSTSDDGTARGLPSSSGQPTRRWASCCTRRATACRRTHKTTRGLPSTLTATLSSNTSTGRRQGTPSHAALPVISVDTKKKELVGDFKNGGQEWQPAGEPVLVHVHDFIDKDLGKAIPYGVYDLASNDAWVSVGVDHDTPEFAVESIARWWRYMGKKAATPRRSRYSSPPTAAAAMAIEHDCWKLELTTRRRDRSPNATVSARGGHVF